MKHEDTWWLCRLGHVQRLTLAESKALTYLHYERQPMCDMRHMEGHWQGGAKRGSELV